MKKQIKKSLITLTQHQLTGAEVESNAEHDTRH